MRILLGSIAMVDDGEEPGITSPDYVVFRPKSGVLHHRWLYYWLRSADGAALIKSLTRGAVRERLLFRRLAAGWIDSPPYPAQLRFAEAVQHVARARAAAEARLEAANALSLAFAASILDSMCGSAALRPLGDFIESFRNGLSRRPTGTEAGPVVLRLADVSTGSIDLSRVRRGNASLLEKDAYSLNEDDLLFIRVNGSRDLVGRCLLVPRLSEPVLFNDHLIRVRLRSDLSSAFVKMISDTVTVRSRILAGVTTSAGQLTISQDLLSSLTIPVPRLETQFKAVKAFGDATAGGKRLGEAVRSELSTLDVLPASLLRRAFRGEL
ncbi:MAG: hypothetical protein WEB59_09810 [Thermoanaerobaculia bacterium]